MPRAPDECLVSLYTGIYRLCLLSNREKSQTIWNKFLGIVTLFLKEMQHYWTFDFVMKFQTIYLGALFLNCFCETMRHRSCGNYVIEAIELRSVCMSPSLFILIASERLADGICVVYKHLLQTMGKGVALLKRVGCKGQVELIKAGKTYMNSGGEDPFILKLGSD